MGFLCSADQTEVHAHVYLLSKVSSVVRQTASQLRSIHRGHVHITLAEIDGPTVGTLLEFLYLGETKMTEKTSENLHTLCQMLDINIGEDKITIQDVLPPTQHPPGPPFPDSDKNTAKKHKSNTTTNTRPLSNTTAPKPAMTSKTSPSYKT